MTTETTAETPTQRLATLILRKPLGAWVAERRDNGASWQAIADELDTVTSGQVAVTREALRIWFGERKAS